MKLIQFIKDYLAKRKKEIQESDNKKFEDKIKSLEVQLKRTEGWRDKYRDALIVSQNEMEELLLSAFKEPSKTIFDHKRDYELAHSKNPSFYPFTGGPDIDIKRALHLSAEDEKDFIDECVVPLLQKYNPNTILDIVEMPQKHFSKRKNWTYEKERVDIWENSLVSWRSLVGDCDALAILINAIIYYSLQRLGFQDHTWRLEFMIVDTLLEGHACNKWLHDDGDWYVVESTLDLSGTFHRKWLNVPLKYDSFYSKFRAFATRKKSWIGTMSSLNNFVEGK